ncbi:hypothetical protein [Serratia marcescens]|uniref:hypothetical protein n=1 Tax=Serratia marcescens TaxID=615 RepID=UPI000450F154|nr:hypothetical protein [Serratia marcescens]EZQ69851.1 hypothetical protein AF53_02731 [Serratia marcescens BIDMC 80]
MKIDYDVSLYREIANFSVNKVVQVSNRKGRKTTIHITNITQLSWQSLQLLVSSGSDRFSKMVFLYREYSQQGQFSESVIRGKPLSSNETKEINEYIKIYRDHGCTKHHEVNDIITKNRLWNNFKTIRSLNDHGEFKGIEGIQPQYFEIVCNILKISGDKGLPLDGYQKY